MTDLGMLLLAARHLDPEEGVMRSGHVVDSADIAALRKVLSVIATSIRDDPPCYCAETSTRNCPRHGNGDHG